MGSLFSKSANVTTIIDGNVQADFFHSGVGSNVITNQGIITKIFNLFILCFNFFIAQHVKYYKVKKIFRFCFYSLMPVMERFQTFLFTEQLASSF